jgi:hypothetical protein
LENQIDPVQGKDNHLKVSFVLMSLIYVVAIKDFPFKEEMMMEPKR